jgi:hypothetical protein
MNRTSFPWFCGAVALWLAAAGAVSGAAANQLSDEEKAAGWKLLFDGQTTSGWRTFKKDTFPTTGWAVEDGWLHCLNRSGGDIISRPEFEQFDLRWEWKIGHAANSGVKYFVTEARPTALGHEYQLLDDANALDARQDNNKHITASFYDVLPPATPLPLKPLGEINLSRILVSGNHVEHWLNGTKVLEYELGSDTVLAAVAHSKFKAVAGFGTRIKGHLLLQAHGGEVFFRNLKIRDLTP